MALKTKLLYVCQKKKNKKKIEKEQKEWKEEKFIELESIVVEMIEFVW